MLEARTLIATVDVMEFLNNSNLHVHEAVLEGTRVNFFIAEDGTTNLTDIFLSQPDTTAEDTSAFSLPFNALRVDGLSLQADYITFVDAKDTISASLGLTELSAKAESWDDMLIALEAQDVCANLQGDLRRQPPLGTDCPDGDGPQHHALCLRWRKAGGQ